MLVVPNEPNQGDTRNCVSGFERKRPKFRQKLGGRLRKVYRAICPHFARLFQISNKALARASREICEEVRSLFARNGVGLLQRTSRARVRRVELNFCSLHKDIVLFLILMLLPSWARAGFLEVVEDVRERSGVTLGGCAWEFPSGESCGKRTVGDSRYCKDHKCAKCDQHVFAGGYCSYHDAHRNADAVQSKGSDKDSVEGKQAVVNAENDLEVSVHKNEPVVMTRENSVAMAHVDDDVNDDETSYTAWSETDPICRKQTAVAEDKKTQEPAVGDDGGFEVLVSHETFERLEKLITERFGVKIGSRLSCTKESLAKHTRGGGAYYLEELIYHPKGYYNAFGYVYRCKQTDRYYLNAISVSCRAPIKDRTSEFENALQLPFVLDWVESDRQPSRLGSGAKESFSPRMVAQWRRLITDERYPRKKLEMAFCDDDTKTCVITTDDILPFIPDADKLCELDRRIDVAMRDDGDPNAVAVKLAATKSNMARATLETETEGLNDATRRLSVYEDALKDLQRQISAGKDEIRTAEAAISDEQYQAKLQTYLKIQELLKVGEAFYKWYSTRMNETELQRSVHYKEFRGKRMAFYGIAKDVKRDAEGDWMVSLLAKAQYLGVWNFNAKFLLDYSLVNEAAKWDKGQFLILIGNEHSSGGLIHEITLNNTTVASQAEVDAVKYFILHPESELQSQIEIAREKVKIAQQDIVVMQKQIEEQRKSVDQKMAQRERAMQMLDAAEAETEEKRNQVTNKVLLQFLNDYGVDEGWLRALRP